MKFVHDINTLSISKLGLMLETGDTAVLLKSIWLPRFVYAKKARAFMEAFEGLFSSHERNKFAQQELIKTTMYNRLLLCKIFLDAHYLKRLNNVMLNWYESEFRTTEVDVDRVVQRAKFYESKIKQYAKAAPEADDKKAVSWDAVVISTELILEITIDRDISVREFKSYYDQAVQRSSVKKD